MPHAVRPGQLPGCLRVLCITCCKLWGISDHIAAAVLMTLHSTAPCSSTPAAGSLGESSCHMSSKRMLYEGSCHEPSMGKLGSSMYLVRQLAYPARIMNSKTDKHSEFGKGQQMIEMWKNPDVSVRMQLGQRHTPTQPPGTAGWALSFHDYILERFYTYKATHRRPLSGRCKCVKLMSRLGFGW
jgi:hypothetical protein